MPRRIQRSPPHGHVEASLTFSLRIGLEAMIGSTPSRERDLVQDAADQGGLGPA